MRPKVLIDLDVLTRVVWNKKEEAAEFLSRVKRGEYTCAFPLFLIIYILRNWKYKKLVDRMVSEIDETATEFLRTSVAKKLITEKTKMPLRIFIKRGSRALGINRQDFTLVTFASIFQAEYLVTYNRVHLKGRQEEISKYLTKYNLNAPEIVFPSELLSPF